MSAALPRTVFSGLGDSFLVQSSFDHDWETRAAIQMLLDAAMELERLDHRRLSAG
jgi:hypothetical protein